MNGPGSPPTPEGAGSTARPGAPRLAVLRLLVGLAAVLPFLPALGNGFVFDDRGLILEHSAVRSGSPWAAWGSLYWPESDSAGLYRPLTTFSFWVDAHLWNLDPAGFVATNLALHLAASLLVLSLLRALFPATPGRAGTAALLFAVHPLHSEAVVGIVGRAELLAALGALLAHRLALPLLRDARAKLLPLLGSSTSLLLGLLAKESAIGLAGLLLHPYLFGPPAAPAAAPARLRQARAAVAAAWAGAIALVLLARVRVLGGLFGLGEVSRIDNPLAHVGLLERIPTALAIQARALGQTLWPATLSPDYSYPEIVPAASLTVLGLAYGAAVLALLLHALRRRDRALLFGPSFAIATGLLTSNLVVPIGTVYGERLLYLPSLGVLWTVVVLGDRCLRRIVPGSLRPGEPAGAGPAESAGRVGASAEGRIPGTAWIAPVLVTIAILALGLRSAVRAPEWRTNLSLFTAASESVPRSTKVWTNLALARLKEGLLPEGLAAAERALTLDPEYAPARQAKGSALIQLGRAEEAIPLLERNRSLGGKRGLESILELGNAYLVLGQGDRAEAEFEEARRRARPDDERWMVGLASAAALQSRWSESRRYWQNAVAVRPEDPEFRSRYAYVLWQDGDLAAAEEIYRQLRSEQPGDPARMNELAWFLARTGRAPEEAIRLAGEAYGLQPDANTADTWLEAWLEARGCAETRAWLDDRAEAFGPETRANLEVRWKERCSGEGSGAGAEGR